MYGQNLYVSYRARKAGDSLLASDANNKVGQGGEGGSGRAEGVSRRNTWTGAVS